VTITRGGQATTDHYPFDGFGRVYGTPLVSIWSTDDDQAGVITTLAGRIDTLVYGAGGRTPTAGRRMEPPTSVSPTTTLTLRSGERST
jgi:hypothetical protein